MGFKGANFLSKVFLFYCRKIGDHPAKLRIINVLHGLLKNQIKVKGFNDATLLLVPKDYISGEIIFNKAYEPLSINLSLELLKNVDGAFVDIGANMGLYTSIVAKNFPLKKTISIEPQENNFAQLKKNIVLNCPNNQDNIILLNIAVGADTGLIKLEKPIGNNNGTFRVVLDKHSNETKYYPMLSLGTILKSLNIGTIGLIKIDVEGYEMEVLKGIDWAQNHKPKNIILEFSDYVNRTGVQAEDILNFLIDKGYRPYSIKKELYSIGNPLPEANMLFTLL